ncbi:MAG: hypothetical protein EOO88_50320 [Pedobacter sp.]|nr:MAG: hypothetical protein EOO88_50320 [Pedobacter sp.]
MSDIKLNEDYKFDVDFDRPGMPYTATVLQPTVFKQNEKYFCSWGEQLDSAIMGTGETPEQAVQEWDQQLTRRLSEKFSSDSIIAKAKELLDADGKTKSSLVENLPDERKGPPATVSQEIPDDAKTGSAKDNVTEKRKFSADQSNANGSEFM